MKRIIISPGEPAGIGPDILIKAIQQKWSCELIVIADPDILVERAALLKLPFTYELTDFTKKPSKNAKSAIKIYPIKQRAPVIPGKLISDNAHYVLEALSIAAQYCLSHPSASLVTGPIHKAIMNEANIAFTGHTEWLAEQASVPKTVMLFVVDQLKVALATTHLPLNAVSTAITKESLYSVLSVLKKGLETHFSLQVPRIGVCGLNPHAGENGYLGREEIDVITPLLNELKNSGWLIEGPLPADTIFTQAMLPRFDTILAMYHDQALPLIKYLGFERAVNVTLGLPYLRTSVDHGTALDLAGSNKADAGSMIKAIKLASR